MSCDALREAIVETGRGQEVGVGTAAAVETHVAHCRACAVRLERERELSAGLRALASDASRNLGSSELEQSLIEAFRERQRPARRAAVRAWIPMAAAAVLLVGAGLWLSRSGAENRTVEQPQLARTARDPSPAPITQASKPATVPLQSRADAAVTRTRPHRNLRPRPSRFVAAEGFVMLPAAANLPPFESGEIVRMELPVTSLPAYGLEIAHDARRPAVEADLLVGQDGQARAIRLVNSARLQPNQ